MATKPTHYPDWATVEEVDPVSGQINRVEPPTARKESGWDRREIPPRQWMNWNFWLVGLWIRYLESGSFGKLDSYTVSTLPDAAENEARMVYVSDETGGAVTAFSDGTDWRRTTDRQVVS